VDCLAQTLIVSYTTVTTSQQSIIITANFTCVPTTNLVTLVVGLNAPEEVSTTVYQDTITVGAVKLRSPRAKVVIDNMPMFFIKKYAVVG